MNNVALKKCKVEFHITSRIAYEYKGYIIAKAFKDTGLGYKEFYIFDKKTEKFLTYETLGKSLIYFKSVEGAVNYIDTEVE